VCVEGAVAIRVQFLEGLPGAPEEALGGDSLEALFELVYVETAVVVRVQTIERLPREL
jgi:hypothetical protein